MSQSLTVLNGSHVSTCFSCFTLVLGSTVTILTCNLFMLSHHLHCSSQMDHIINNYGVVTPPERPAPKVSYGGQDNLDKAQGAGMGPLLRMEGNKTPREPKQGRLHQESQGGSVLVASTLVHTLTTQSWVRHSVGALGSLHCISH